jgi:hypothetical protein
LSNGGGGGGGGGGNMRRECKGHFSSGILHGTLCI